MNWLEFSDEVKQGKDNHQPIVALESTIISHGMPYPQNLETAQILEGIIREGGATPATIGIMDGKIKIGMSAQELELFASHNDITKVSRRDLPTVLSQKKYGATTVASTMICAQLAGIPVFATGGIGGVHREGEKSMDISADLMELSQTNVAVVCAGAKAILDIPRTMEYLETMGVPTLGYQTDEFPAFYTRESGCQIPKIDSPTEIAQIMKAKWDLRLQGGVLIGNPVAEEYAMDPEEIRNAIDTALTEAKSENIEGKEVTPYLLNRVKQLTEGKSLETNIALVKSNAFVATQIAKAFSLLTIT